MEEARHEPCAACGFDPAMWNDQDALTTLRALSDMAALSVERCPAPLLQQRPDPDTWSIIEYLEHLRGVAWASRFGIDEGHPAEAGRAGENLTIAGLDWTAMRAGLHVRIGDVHAVVSGDSTPCTKISASFADGDSNRIDHHRHPGWSRWYTDVRHGGTIAPGGVVTVTSEP